MLTRESFDSDSRHAEYVEWYEKAKEQEYKFWIGDIPVQQHLLQLFNEFKHKRPDIVVKPSNNTLRWDSVGLKAFEGVSIAFKEAPDVVVGYLEGCRGDDNFPKYTVISERICNEKYSDYNKLYHTKTTKKLTLAIKNALQFVKPFDLDYMARKESGSASHALDTLKEKANDILYYKFDADRKELFKEVSNMVNAGYTPSTPKFVQMMDIFKGEGEYMKELLTYKPRKCYVWAKVDRLEYRYDDEEVVVALNIGEVPEDIRNKVAVLQIADKNSPIKDVGVRISESTYWLFV
jgi:hypothetical protein